MKNFSFVIRHHKSVIEINIYADSVEEALQKAKKIMPNSVDEYYVSKIIECHNYNETH